MEVSFSPPNLKRIGYPKNTIYMKKEISLDDCTHVAPKGEFHSQQRGVSLEQGEVSAKTNLAVTPHPVDTHSQENPITRAEGVKTGTKPTKLTAPKELEVVPQSPDTQANTNEQIRKLKKDLDKTEIRVSKGIFANEESRHAFIIQLELLGVKLQTWKLAKQDELIKLEGDILFLVDMTEKSSWLIGYFGMNNPQNMTYLDMILKQKLAQKQQERDDVKKILGEIE